MTFGQDPIPATTLPEITAEAAQEIFNLLKTQSLASAREANGSKYPLQFFYAVDKEFKRMAKEFNEWASGKVIAPEVSHFDEETGEKVVDTPEVRYELTTETDLVSKVSSDILNSLDVLNVIEPEGIWKNYVDSFKTTE